MKTLDIALCNESDLAILVELARLQKAEERGDEIPSDLEIRENLLQKLQVGMAAYFLKWDAEIVGFAMVDITQRPYSLKSFYASRNFRRSGLKSLNFRKLVDMLETDVLEVEVSAGNVSSLLFWETFGFKERKVCLRYSKTK